MSQTVPPGGQAGMSAQFPKTLALLQSLSLPEEVKQNLRNSSPPDPKTMQTIMALAQVVEKALSGQK